MEPVTFVPAPVGRSDFMIHPACAARFHITGKKSAFVSFGNIRRFVWIKTETELPENRIFLSQRLMNELHLPEYPVYELSVNGPEILIGPYIGLLVSSEDSELTRGKLERLTVYMRDYANLHGAVAVFALDKTDPVGRLVEGYCYNPESGAFEAGIFPYPAAIYRTIGLSNAWKNHFLTAIGDRVFNGRYFGKWEMYNWFSGDAEIGPHLPKTRRYQAYEDVAEALAECGAVYLKPASGLGGRGIIKASLEGGGMTFRYREEDKNMAVRFDAKEGAEDFIHEKLRPGRYLIQRAVSLMTYMGRVVDFRCVMQKNQAEKWECKAIIGRCGEKNSIVSNISSGGSAFRIENVGKLVSSIPKEKTAGLKAEITAFAEKVCRTLDGYGIHCGTLGLDVGVDADGKLWLIEINNRDPDPTIALNVRDISLYYRLKTGPLYYAKALAGFRNGQD